ncbi:ADC synthase [Dimargaris cristalligena]|uniref:aminodeoxychorismate synthase n=1 Tax=Dimargaris cristalligena TaxID=215637 RepID=A0A4P9ZZ20_9FUNG|nr:ADC synthase [Dimargaris cristalligena]|eukprot:RKP39004.1 ADC synthase [Dimargaris cristalligena]
MGSSIPIPTPTLARQAAPRVLIIDNYDSYTHNLFHLWRDEQDLAQVVLIRNDQYDWDHVRTRILPHVDAVIISPGPGRRDHGAVMGAMVLPPIFGVCLGHQAIAAAFGSEVKQAPAIFHGQVSLVHHADASANNHTNALFQGIPSPFRAVRYHSLSVHDPLPESIIPIAWTHDAVSATETARVVMALRHRTLPLYGVQFHPESVCTTAGRSMLDNFFQMVDDYWCQSVPTSTPSSPTGLAKTQRPSTLPIAVQEMGLKGKPGLAPPAAAPAPQFSVYCQALPGIMSKATFISPDRDESALFRHLYSSSPAAFWLDSARKGSPQSRFSYFGDFTGSGACTMPKLSENLRPRSSSSTNGGDPPTTFWQWLAHWLPDVETSSVLQPWETTELDIANSIPTALAFRCGLVGIMGYDMKAETMGASPSGDQPTVSLDTPSNSPPSTTSLSTSWPDATFGFTDRCVTLDHDTGSIYLLTLVRTPTHSPAQSPSLSIADTIGLGLNYADDDLDRRISRTQISSSSTKPPTAPLNSNDVHVYTTPRVDYVRAIEKSLDYIQRGESYELCLTTPLVAPLRQPIRGFTQALDFYLRVRRHNPAPYAAFLYWADIELVIASTSPERFLAVSVSDLEAKVGENGKVERGPAENTTDAHDQQLAVDLAHDVKERAENLMIVDLIRHDLFTDCVPSSVHVPHLMVIESYQTVHQMVTTVRGQLRPQVGAVQCLTSCFPPGSMTGAPKHRSVEILETLETRGLYSGCLGYFSVHGAMDMSVVIRTTIVGNQGSQVYLGAGGAITVLSDPDREYDEVLTKFSAVWPAIRDLVGTPNDTVA